MLIVMGGVIGVTEWTPKPYRASRKKKAIRYLMHVPREIAERAKGKKLRVIFELAE